MSEGEARGLGGGCGAAGRRQGRVATARFVALLAGLILSVMGCQQVATVGPFGEENYYFAANGLRLHYTDEGKGEVVLLLHDAGTWSYSWKETLARLREKYRVLALDLPGSGLSDKPSNAAEAFKLEALAGEVAGFLYSAGAGEAAIVGHGWGGNVALAFAEAYGDRTAGLVVTGAWALAPAVEAPLMARVRDWPVLGSIACRWPPAWLLRKHFRPLFGEDAELLTSDWIAQVKVPLGDVNWCNVFSPEVYSPFDRTLAEKVNDISPRVLLLWGGKDRIAPVPAAKALEAALPNARLKVFDMAGHMLPEERPAEFNSAVLAFVDTIFVREKGKPPRRTVTTARPELPNDAIVRQVDQRCPCLGDELKTRRGARARYRRCVRVAAKELRAKGLITVREQAALVRRATHSTCGRPGFVRCCRRSRCRVMRPRRCARMGGHGLGPGSCYPNPCEGEGSR